MIYRSALILLAVLLSGCFGNGVAIDASGDFRHVKLPPNWRAECVDADDNLRTDTPAVTQTACKNILGNNLILKARRK